jgi:hypothetical protein
MESTRSRVKVRKFTRADYAEITRIHNANFSPEVSMEDDELLAARPHLRPAQVPTRHRGRPPRRFAAKIPAVEAQGIQLGFVKYPAWVHYVRTF